MPADVITDEEGVQLEAAARSMDDETLVFVMYGLLMRPDYNDELPCVAGASAKSASAARYAYCEIAERWIPADVFERAMREVLDDAC